MKKIHIILFVIFSLLCITGCDNSSNVITEMSNDKQGTYEYQWTIGSLYYIDVIELNAKTADFTRYYHTSGFLKKYNKGTTTYQIENLALVNKDNIQFDLTLDDVRIYACVSAFGSISCTNQSGYSHTYHKTN